MRWKMLLPMGVLAGVIWLVHAATHQPLLGVATDPAAQPTPEIVGSTQKIDEVLLARWAEAGLKESPQADDLTVLRRVTLALMGTVPSLEELRAFEADREENRLARWTARFLRDDRFADYFAERLARGFVGTEGGQFIVYRRDRFVNWLSEQLKANRPYPELVRDMIAGTGLWTDHPEVNFVMAGYSDGNGFDENKLAGRAVRAFLGQRIDCAQCHDHPFDHWKQHEFAGLAAHFGQAQVTVVGLQENRKKQFVAQDRRTQKDQAVPPAVPFHSEWEPSEGSRRQRLAEWMTHPNNRRLERAMVNRVWGLLFGRPWIEPVDDLPDPFGEEFDRPAVAGSKHAGRGVATRPDLLDILGADFREQGYDLRRLIEVIIASKAFRLDSRSEVEDVQELDRLKSGFAVFPLTRLRPEQVMRSLQQAASITTIDRESHLISRAMQYVRTQDFVKEYGDLGENELEDRAGTIPQALLRMNGRLTRETIEANPFTASGRIASMAADDRTCLELCYLVCLTRRPTPEEMAFFQPMLAGKTRNSRARAVEDIYWILFNSPEFAWNH